MVKKVSRSPFYYAFDALKRNEEIGPFLSRNIYFTKANFELLKNQIHSSIINGNAVLYKIERNPTGVIKFEYRIHVAGANGASATVVSVYGIGPKDGKPRMITNYIK